MTANDVPSKEELQKLMRQVDIRVGHMLTVERHPNAEKLYVESVDIGEETPRTVVSGLVPYFESSDIQGKLCLFVANLKPAAMRGITSQAMVLIAHDKTKDGYVELLSPPKESKPGDKVCIFPDQLDINPVLEPVMNPKKKIFESIQPHLTIRATDGVVLFQEYPLSIPGKGFVRSLSIRDGSIS